jgi:hypothetical protein
VLREEMLTSVDPGLISPNAWRHGLNTDNALNSARRASAHDNSDGPEYNVMEDDFVFPNYKAQTQMLAEPAGGAEGPELGDEIFELPQGQGDVQVEPHELETTMFPGHFY